MVAQDVNVLSLLLAADGIDVNLQSEVIRVLTCAQDKILLHLIVLPFSFRMGLQL